MEYEGLKIKLADFPAYQKMRMLMLRENPRGVAVMACGTTRKIKGNAETGPKNENE